MSLEHTLQKSSPGAKMSTDIIDNNYFKELCMAKATFTFPSGFLWGTATAAHQVEGNNTNNTWWAWEQETGHILNGDKSGLACDWWGGRWREDFERAAECRQNSHRFSIEWSRVQPARDRWDEYALEHYRDMARGLIERHMTPIATLHHFSDPIWLAEMGSWEIDDIVKYFEAFVRKTVEALKEYISAWVTINEPNIFAALAYQQGQFPPGKKDFASARKVIMNLLKAHATAYRVIHQIQPQAQVGIAPQYLSIHPKKPWSPLDRWTAGLMNNVMNEAIPRTIRTGILTLPGMRRQLVEVKNTWDFIGIQYYTREYINFDLGKASDLFIHRSYREEAEKSDGNWLANEPEGMFEALKWGQQFNIPIIITENGVNDKDDHLRPRYLIQHLHQVWRAINFNIPVKGYYHWSLVDNFEWERGWTQRFGLWELDIETQARRKRPSVDLYAEICRQNGISSDIVAHYAPQLLAKLFPDE